MISIEGISRAIRSAEMDLCSLAHMIADAKDGKPLTVQSSSAGSVCVNFDSAMTAGLERALGKKKSELGKLIEARKAAEEAIKNVLSPQEVLSHRE